MKKGLKIRILMITMKIDRKNRIKEMLIIKYKDNKEIINYLICGFLTFIVSMLIYALLSEALRINVLISNVLTWIIAVYFAFTVNRRFVFESNNKITDELLQFYSGRIVTLLIEQVILYIFIIRLSFDNLIIKLIAQIIIIILNYIISKFIVFKKENNDK